MKYIKQLVVLALAIALMPNVLSAAEKVKIDNYETMNLKQTLAAEEMEEAFTKYTEKDDQITIYLFRGQGCGYCRAFLTFLNGITEEYGKYFKLVSFEVWNNSDNNDLMNKISTFLGKPAQGVPYIIIGDQTFPGYADVYDDSIKSAIETEYKKAAKDRYDVFEEYNKSLKSTSNMDGTAVLVISLINLVLVGCATVVVIAHQNKKFDEIESLLKKESKKK